MIRNWRTTVSSVILATAIALTGGVSATEADACFGGGGKRYSNAGPGGAGYRGPRQWNRPQLNRSQWNRPQWNRSAWNQRGWNRGWGVPRWRAAPARYPGYGYRGWNAPRPHLIGRQPYGVRPAWGPAGFARPFAMRVPGPVYAPALYQPLMAPVAPSPFALPMAPTLVPLQASPYAVMRRANPWRGNPYGAPGRSATRPAEPAIRWVKDKGTPGGNVWARAPKVSEAYAEPKARYNPWRRQPTRPTPGPVWRGGGWR